jgi:hypothetical protein
VQYFDPAFARSGSKGGRLADSDTRA